MNDDNLQFQQQCQSELVYSEDVPVSYEVSPNVSSAAVDMHDESLDCFDATHYGFVLVMDNIDKNVRPNFQRCTLSQFAKQQHLLQIFHFFHKYSKRLGYI